MLSSHPLAIGVANITKKTKNDMTEAVAGNTETGFSISGTKIETKTISAVSIINHNGNPYTDIHIDWAVKFLF